MDFLCARRKKGSGVIRDSTLVFSFQHANPRLTQPLTSSFPHRQTPSWHGGDSTCSPGEGNHHWPGHLEGRFSACLPVLPLSLTFSFQPRYVVVGSGLKEQQSNLTFSQVITTSRIREASRGSLSRGHPKGPPEAIYLSVYKTKVCLLHIAVQPSNGLPDCLAGRLGTNPAACHQLHHRLPGAKGGAPEAGTRVTDSDHQHLSRSGD